MAPRSLARSSLADMVSTATMRLAPATQGPLQHVEADAAATDHRHGRAGLDPCDVEGRAHAGGDAAAGEGGRLQRNVVGDAHHHGLGHHAVLGQRTGADERADLDVAPWRRRDWSRSAMSPES